MSKLKIYGHYVSQPARSVLWLCRAQDFTDFEFVKKEPLNGETRTPEFIRDFPTATVPTIDDGGFKLGEVCVSYNYSHYDSMFTILCIN